MNNYGKKIALAVAVCAAFSSVSEVNAAASASASVQVTGEVIETTCPFTVDGSTVASNQSVIALGPVSKDNLSADSLKKFSLSAAGQSNGVACTPLNNHAISIDWDSPTDANGYVNASQTAGDKTNAVLELKTLSSGAVIDTSAGGVAADTVITSSNHKVDYKAISDPSQAKLDYELKLVPASGQTTATPGGFETTINYTARYL